MIQDRNGEVSITNDGATILEKMIIENQICKLLVQVSKSQDHEIGDGTTGVLVIATSLLEASESLIDIGIHPLRITEGYDTACHIASEKLQQISKSIELSKSDPEPLIQTCMTTLSSKIAGRSKRSIAEICVHAVLSVADAKECRVNLELIKIFGKVGGKLEDTTLINGVIIDKDISHPQMKKSIQNPKIAILTCPFEPPKPKTKHNIEIDTKTQFELLRKIEHAYFVDMVKRCKDVGANCIICQWGFDDEANHLLMKNDLSALRWVGGTDLELIAMATGACIVSRFQELTKKKLGNANIFSELSLGSNKEKVLFIERSSDSKAVTILVRGGNKMVLEETKRSINDSICVVRNLLRSNTIIYGGGSSELSCSLAISEAADTTPGTEHFPLRAFAEALEQIPYALAENAGQEPNQAVKTAKSHQLKHCNPYIGIDCDESGCHDMREKSVFETLIGKHQQLCLATQVCKMILKIDGFISPRKI
eukprot:gnl/TRDRNA2_/TRDRNA2_173807_c0_seq1.p1 gnl/TRDRNA2_/TRDRNA2_173807_c0~~gnl/TRDRNA2_/TRDRNA2_173807_c0_seq1.p1  ORF type:complete len:550 (+),score=-19.43 gnl/TRDRNA2_/TRDRNA2_173807_c0_seq1:209-1651(+)